MAGGDDVVALALETANTRGNWIQSIVTVIAITELQEDGYLFLTVKFRSPIEGDAILPTSALPTFYEGSGCFSSLISSGTSDFLSTLCPRSFFFYGLDFHLLAPKSVLHIASFITICEAFLCMEPHFGLLLKVFGVKSHSSGSKLADCGRAMISKIPRITWPRGHLLRP